MSLPHSSKTLSNTLLLLVSRDPVKSRAESANIIGHCYPATGCAALLMAYLRFRY